jgi:hypothetical protein
MGKQNRQRRAAKAKRRSAQQRVREVRPIDDQSPRGREAREPIETLVFDAITAAAHRTSAVLTGLIAQLAKRNDVAVEREVERSAMKYLAVIWNAGWQPAELIRAIGRQTNPVVQSLALRCAAADFLQWEPADLDPRWSAQIEALGIERSGSTTGWLRRFADEQRFAPVESLRLAFTLLGLIVTLPRLPHVIPPPGTNSGRDERRVVSNDPGASGMLAKVRALLAQAESTTFEAEAETFTAKAQELMARHSIDEALVWEHANRDSAPITVRLAIDDPYADIKSLLLQIVAAHSRCSSIFMQRHSMSSVVGFAADVMTVEVLYTSLLVQAEAALREHARSAPPGSRARSRSFRSSFLMSYAQRIDKRLTEVNRRVESDAVVEHGDALLPVLAARSEEVHDAVESMFGAVTSNVVRGGRDSAGWALGASAADQAKLNRADLTR